MQDMQIAMVEGVDVIVGGHVRRSNQKDVKQKDGDIVRYILSLLITVKN